MRWRLIEDSIYSGIRHTDYPLHYEGVYATFGEAKAALVEYLRAQRDMYRYATQDAHALRASDITGKSD